MSRARALTEQARAVEAELRAHKKAARGHRLAAIRRECDRLGIVMTLAP